MTLFNLFKSRKENNNEFSNFLYSLKEQKENTIEAQSIILNQIILLDKKSIDELNYLDEDDLKDFRIIIDIYKELIVFSRLLNMGQKFDDIRINELSLLVDKLLSNLKK